MTGPLLSVEDLRVDAGNGLDIVRGVSFSIGPGETLGLVGDSGSGKTLSAMAVAGLLQPGLAARGRMLLNGVDLSSMSPQEARSIRTRDLGVVFQNPSTALNPRMTVGAQVTEALSPDLLADSAKAAVAVLRLLDDAGIPRARERLSAYPHELSGGLAQRVVIAMALARSPRLLIADEPTTALDVTVQKQVLDLIARLQAERKFSVLLITHDMGVIADRAGSVAVMEGGRIVESGRTREVFDRPKTAAAARFIKAVPRLAFGQDDPPPGQEILAVRDLSKRFGSAPHALSSVRASIPAGRAVGIVGESGSGKTTFARIIAGLEAADSGSVRFRGIERRPRTRLADIQYVFQDPYASLDPRLAIGETVAEPLRAQGVSRQAASVQALALLREVGLDHSLSGRRPGTLSGGQRQRVGIARAIATDPALLIADEPVAALDSTARDRILALLDELRRRRGMTLLLISHDLSIVTRLCSEVIVMRGGKVIEAGPTRRVFEHSEHPYTRQLIEAVPGRQSLIEPVELPDAAA